MISKKQLEQLYWKEKKTLEAIGVILGKGETTIFYWMDKYGIKRRTLSEALKGHSVSKEAREKISKNHIYLYGKDNANWKGERSKTADGYIRVYKPEHPNVVAKRYVLEHRLVMEKHIGRYLNRKEVVHHINGIKTDNRIKNLVLTTRNNHDYIESKKRKRKKDGTFN